MKKHAFNFNLMKFLTVEVEFHTVPHFKGSFNAKVEPDRLEYYGIFIVY